jgi:hypothetical protein
MFSSLDAVALRVQAIYRSENTFLSSVHDEKVFMIRSIPRSELDKKQIAEQISTKDAKAVAIKASRTDPVDYSQFIVTKPWGYEFLVFENEQVAIWMLHLVRHRKTSVHCHPNKKRL